MLKNAQILSLQNEKSNLEIEINAKKNDILNLNNQLTILNQNLENANNVDFIYCKTNQTTETINPTVFS